MVQIPSSMVASLLATTGRDARGILFRILVADLSHDERPGNAATSGGEGREDGTVSAIQLAGGLLEPRQRLMMRP